MASACCRAPACPMGQPRLQCGSHFR